MLDAVRAEAAKLIGHRKVTWTVLGALPVLLTLIFLGVQIYEAVNGRPAPTRPRTAETFAAGSLSTWMLPQNLAWLLAAAWAAVAFGGEYRWNTLKLIVPHRSRVQIMLAKYLVILAGLAASLAVFGVVAIVLQLLGATIDGRGVPPGVEWADLLARHVRIWAQLMIAQALIVAYAALASVILRSTAGGIVVTVLASVVLSLPQQVWVFVSMLAYRLSPAYAVSNLQAWASARRGLPTLSRGGMEPAHDWLLSLGIAGLWIFGLAALTTLIFRRQDFN